MSFILSNKNLDFFLQEIKKWNVSTSTIQAVWRHLQNIWKKKHLQQENIPVGYIPPACYLYVFHNEQVWTCLGDSFTMGSKLKKFEQTGLQSWPSDISIGWRFLWCGGSEAQCILSNSHMGPQHPPRLRQTDTTEKITFPQLRWRAEKTLTI